jgi:hypothetical protein
VEGASRGEGESLLMEPEQTEESQRLDRHPGVRESVSSLPEFVEWSSRLPTVVVDDVTYYLRGGDMLKDRDQIIEWVRRFHPQILGGCDQESS